MNSSFIRPPAKDRPIAANPCAPSNSRPLPPNLCNNGGNQIMIIKSYFPKLGAIACVLAFSLNPHISLAAPSPAVQEGATEVETSLFLLDARWKSPKGGAATPAAISVVWIPQPIQKYCVGKDQQECATIDFCIRTTTKTVAMCKSLPPNLRNLPPYS